MCKCSLTAAAALAWAGNAVDNCRYAMAQNTRAMVDRIYQRKMQGKGDVW